MRGERDDTCGKQPSEVRSEAGAEQAPPGRRVAASTASLIAANVAVALLGTIALRQMTHRLGISSYGELVTVMNFIAVAMLLADLGVNTYTGREIARHKVDAASILGRNLGLRLVLSVVIVPIFVGVGALIYPNSRTQIREGILLLALVLPFEAIRAVSTSYFVATIQNYKTALISLITQVLYVSGVVITLQLGFGLTGCFLSYVAAMFITAIIAYLAVRRSVAFVPLLKWRSWWGLLRHSLGIGSIQVVNVLYLRTNILVLSLITNSRTVAVYAVAATIVTFLLVVPNAFMTSMLPLLVTSTADRLSVLVDRCVTNMAMVGVLSVAGTTCLSASIVHVLAPPQFAASAVVLSILSLSILFTCFTSVFAYSSFARDQHHWLLLISSTGLVVNVVLDLAMVPSLGANGAAVATDVVEALILVGTYVIFRRRVGIRFTAWGRTARIIGAGALVGALCRLLFEATMPVGFLQLCVGLILIPSSMGRVFYVLRCFPPAFTITAAAQTVTRTVRDGLRHLRRSTE